jgi:hypothetical protein
MRKPRDIDAELRALADKAKDLKARKVTQLGELVIATGAEALLPEVLAGVLIAAAGAPADQMEAWRQRGAAFFQQQGGKRSSRSQTGDRAHRDGAGAS